LTGGSSEGRGGIGIFLGGFGISLPCAFSFEQEPEGEWNKISNN
jgi:hypothetical protein